MEVTVGTFNVNNLFSRFNFKAEVGEKKPKDQVVRGKVSYTFSGKDAFYRLREYKGKLVKAKSEKDTATIAARIMAMKADVLAVQEVEDLDTLLSFNKDKLKGMFKYVALIEGNDPRLIDVGLLSRLPIGGLTSWRFAVHDDAPKKPVFGRDLLQADILTADRKKILFTIYNNHLKSRLTDWRQKDKAKADAENNLRRRQQAEMIGKIVATQGGTPKKVIIVGDMNDPVDSPYLEGFTKNRKLGMVNAVTNPTERGVYGPDTPNPTTTAWSHRFVTDRKAAFDLFDQIWVSADLEKALSGSFVGRRKNKGGDASDHDPVWITLKV